MGYNWRFVELWELDTALEGCVLVYIDEQLIDVPFLRQAGQIVDRDLLLFRELNEGHRGS